MTGTTSTILRSPTRILISVLLLMFVVEVAVMFVLPHILPGWLSESGKAIVDAILLTLVCAPVLWLLIIGPLRRIAIQEHQRSETIVASAREAILTFDREGQITSGNLAARELFGHRDDSLIGRSLRSLVPELPTESDTWPADFQTQGLTAAGVHFPIQVSVSNDPSQSQPLRIAIIHDRTETEKAEAERINMARETEALRAQQMMTLAQLATGVAHEIRNPLTSIKMLIQVNRDKFAAAGLPTDDLELVEQEIRRMERSVNGLLDYARPEIAEFTPFPIREALDRTVRLIEGRCQSQNVNIEIAAPPEPIEVLGDASQIQQLLVNLTLNAIDAMPTGGTLKMFVNRESDNVVISVSDNGTGINENVLEKLFTPFVTTKPQGVGLGLGICRRIAQSHGGTLVGSNHVAGGAVFELTLPVHGHERSL